MRNEQRKEGDYYKIGSARQPTTADNGILTRWEDELDCRNYPPSSRSCTGRKSFVDTGGENSTHIEEELQRDDNKTSEGCWNNLRLVCAVSE